MKAGMFAQGRRMDEAEPSNLDLTKINFRIPAFQTSLTQISDD